MRAIVSAMVLLIFININAKIFIREYTYRASDSDSKNTARAIALEQVKRLLLEEVGVYIQGSIKNQESELNGVVSSLTKTDIQVLSAGIAQTKVLDEIWNGESFWLKAEIKVNEKDVLTKLDNLVNNIEGKKALEAS